MIQEGSFIADRYEVITRIGAGGMSDVYKAKDHVLGRYVAIKVLKQEFSEDQNFVSKFRTEAQSAAALEHPNIVNIYDVGSEEGMYYIVMEYIAGMTLKTYIEKKRRLNYKETISIAIQVGRGIEAAHKNRIVHRDIKPQNIMISNDGKVKVTDFGIARAASNNTIHSDVMGSVHYTSPEQARNGFVDNKSDIYSLGIVMYEMVTGRVPYDGDTAVAVAIQHLQDEMVPPSAYAEDVPLSLEKIILKCTQKSPDRRYQDMAEVLVDLKRVLINPDEDFVRINDGAGEKTRIMPEDEVREIRKQAPHLIVTPEPEEEEEEYQPVRKQQPVKKATRTRVKEVLPPEPDDEEEEEDEDDDDERGMNPKMEKVVTILGIAAAAVIVFIIVYLLLYMTGVIGKGKDSTEATEVTEVTESVSEKEETKKSEASEPQDDRITMIDVRGYTLSQAQEALHELGIGIRQEGEQSSAEYPEGTIIQQSIEAGEKVEKNTTLNVIISNGAGTINVPDVKGMSYDDAASIMRQNGFEVSRAEEYSSEIAEGKVISTMPDSTQSAKKGDTITLIVSKGEAPPTEFAMPNYIGQDQDPVVAELKNKYQCSVTINEEANSTYEKGKVVGLSPAPGETVKIGASVFVAVSKGPEQATTVFSINQYVKVPESDSVIGVSYRLEDANHNVIIGDTAVTEFTMGEDGSRRFKVSATNITTSTGLLYITWTLSDGSVQNNAEYPKTVEFKSAG